MLSRTPTRVLVIDDASGVRTSLALALTHAGLAVEAEADGRRGLDRLAREPFDVVVTDLWMPGADGLQVIKQVRRDHPSLRIFAMTGGGPQMSIEAADALSRVWGAEHVFMKPFDEDLLIQAIREKPGG